MQIVQMTSYLRVGEGKSTLSLAMMEEVRCILERHLVSKGGLSITKKSNRKIQRMNGAGDTKLVYETIYAINGSLPYIIGATLRPTSYWRLLLNSSQNAVLVMLHFNLLEKYLESRLPPYEVMLPESYNGLQIKS